MSGTIEDFSDQWSNYREQHGFFVSEELMNDILHPFVRVSDLAGKAVAEVGCGNGCFIKKGVWGDAL